MDPEYYILTSVLIAVFVPMIISKFFGEKIERFMDHLFIKSSS